MVGAPLLTLSAARSSPNVQKETKTTGAAVNDDLTREDLFQAADRLVEEVLSAAGVTRPPVDVVALALRRFGMTVRKSPTPARRVGNGRRRVQSARV